MTHRLAVIDTNIAVSGLLTGDPGGPTARVVSAMLSGRLGFLLSLELLSEYRRVLLRPKISERHALSEQEVDSLLETLATLALIRSTRPAKAPHPPDPGDEHLWALARAQPGAILVTGDRRLLEAEDPGFSVITAASFVAWLDLQED